MGPVGKVVHGLSVAVPTPVRMVIGAPLALVGGLATRLVLAIRRRSPTFVPPPRQPGDRV